MQFLDANIFIYSAYENKDMEKCHEIIRAGGMTDTLVLAETFNIVEKTTDMKRAQRFIKSILKSNIKIEDISQNIIFESLKKIDDYNLSIFDMIHYITAKLNDCNTIISYDTDFDNLEIPRQEP